MKCPKCGGRSYVVDAVDNPVQKETYRKLKCKKCDNVFYTVEFEAVRNRRFMRDWFVHHRG